MVKIANTTRTTISLPKGLPEQAHKAGVNISATAAKAVLQEINKIKRETGQSPKERSQ